MFTREQLVTLSSIALVMAVRKYREYQMFMKIMTSCVKQLSKDE